MLATSWELAGRPASLSPSPFLKVFFFEVVELQRWVSEGLEGWWEWGEGEEGSLAGTSYQQRSHRWPLSLIKQGLVSNFREPCVVCVIELQL